MRRWKVAMTFEGRADGETSHEASQAFKRALGVLAPEQRLGITMTGLNVVLIEEPDPTEAP